MDGGNDVLHSVLGNRKYVEEKEEAGEEGGFYR